MKKFKIRIYKLNGPEKGNLDHEEFFDTKEKLIERYNELFKYTFYSLNPTGWELVNGEWERIYGL